MSVLWGLIFLPATAALAQLTTSYRLVFTDEFNGTSVNTTKWNIASPGWTMPNSASAASADKVSVGNGVLTLSATRTASSGTTQFSSGSISSYQKYTFDGGYVEARIDLPSTPGSWPAFWGLYDGWPPEADIMEFPLTTNGGTNGYVNDWYHTAFHYTNSSGSAAAGAGSVDTNVNLTNTGYHIFAMDWVSDTSVKFFFDGSQKTSFSSAADVAEMVNMYMILDYAVGGWPGTPSTSQWAVGASDLTLVDWVRVWQVDANPDVTSNWNINGGGSFNTSGNWNNGLVPRYGNRTAYFGRVGSASTATITMPNWIVFGGITLDGAAGGTTAYSIGDSSDLIHLAGQPLGSSPNGATVQALSASAASHNIGARLELWSDTIFRNDMTGGQTLNINSDVSGWGVMSITGAGAVVLNSANNSYTNYTSIGIGQGAGVLRPGASNAIGGGGVVIGPDGNASTARLELSGGHIQAAAIDIRGRNNSSVGIQNVSGNNTLAGMVTANVGGSIYQIQSDAGTLQLAGGLQSGTGARTFTLQGAGSGIVSGPIQNGSGTVAVTKAGAGTWALTGTNTHTGATTVNSGTLRLTVAPVARYTFDNVLGGTVVNDGNGGAAMNGTLTGGAAIAAGGKSGNGVSLAGGASVNINNPIVDLGYLGTWTVSAWVKTTTAGSCIFYKGNGGWSSGNTAFYLGDGAGGGSGGIPGAVRWGGGFFQGAAGTATVTDNAWHLVTYVNNAGTYLIYVDGVAQSLSTGNDGFGNADVGTVVRLGLATNPGDGATHFNGMLDTVEIYSQALTAAQVTALYNSQLLGGSFAATTNIAIASGATLDVDSINQTFSGVISGGGSLVKNGVNTLTLTGANTHTGATALNAGTTFVNGSLAAGSAVSVASGATLAGIGTIGGTVTFADNTIHAPGSATGIGTQTVNGALSYAATSRVRWNLNTNSNAAGAASRATAGTVTVTSGAAIDLTLNNSGSTVNYYDTFWTEPRSWTVVSSSNMAGTFTLGTVSNDSGGRTPATYGAFTLNQGATGAVLNWTPKPFAAWRGSKFGVNAGNAATTDFLANPDGDVLSNAWEYFHDTDPKLNTASQVQTQVLGGRLAIVFPRNTAANDVVAVVRGADSPEGPWTDLAQSTGGGPFTAVVGGVTVSETGTGSTRNVEVRDLYDVTDPAHPRRFLRLWIQQQ